MDEDYENQQNPTMETEADFTQGGFPWSDSIHPFTSKTALGSPAALLNPDDHTRCTNDEIQPLPENIINPTLCAFRQSKEPDFISRTDLLESLQISTSTVPSLAENSKVLAIKYSDNALSETSAYDPERCQTVEPFLNHPALPPNIRAQSVHIGDITMTYPLDQMTKQEEANKAKLIREMGLKLKNRYKRWDFSAIPWMKNMSFPIESYYVALRMHSEDTIGRLDTESCIDIDEIFEGDEIYRIVIEGRPGYGKTTLCGKLAYDWANKADYMSRFRLVILLQLRYLDCSLEDAIMEEIKLRNSNSEALLEAVEFCAEDVLLILDGYDELPLAGSRREVMSLLSQSFYPTMCVLMTTRPHSDLSKDLRKMCQKRIGIVGMNLEHQKRFLYSDVSMASEKRSRILTVITAQDTKELFQCPLLYILLCFLVSESDLPYTKKISTLYMRMFDYMVRNSLHREDETVTVDLFNEDYSSRSPQDIYNRLVLFGKLVLKNYSNNQVAFTEQEIVDACGDSLITYLGFLNKIAKIQCWISREYFEPIHKTFLEFLVACYLEDLSNKDLGEFCKIVRALSRDDGDSFISLMTFLVGLLRDRASLLFQEIPVYTFCKSDRSICSIVDERILPANASFFQAVINHFPRYFEFICNVEKGAVYLDYWDVIFNVHVLDYYEEFIKLLHSIPPVIMKFHFEVDKKNIVRHKNSETSITEMPFSTQMTAANLVQHDGQLLLYALNKFACDVLIVCGFISYDKWAPSYFLSLAQLVCGLQPRKLKLCAYWLSEQMEILLKQLILSHVQLEDLELEDHTIKSDQEAEFLAETVLALKVSRLKIAFLYNVAEFGNLFPIFEALILSPASCLQAFHMEFNSEILDLTQETIDVLVAALEASQSLNEFSYIASSAFFGYHLLRFNLCQICRHGEKTMKRIAMSRALLIVDCECKEDPPLRVVNLEIVCDVEFRPDLACGTISRCVGLEKLTCDCSVASVAPELVSNNWVGYREIRSFRLVVLNDMVPQCWLFIAKFKELSEFFIEFRKPATTFYGVTVLKQEDWLHFMNGCRSSLDTIEFCFNYIPKNLIEIVQEFALAVTTFTAIGTGQDSQCELNDSTCLSLKEIRIRFLKQLRFADTKPGIEPLLSLLKNVLLSSKDTRSLTFLFQEPLSLSRDTFFLMEDVFSEDTGFEMTTTRESFDWYVVNVKCKECDITN